jgi:hypothetical protein
LALHRLAFKHQGLHHCASRYDHHVVSYHSDGYNTHALMTIPNRSRPATGCIRPLEYRTPERYVAYVHAIARNGYIVFKPGLRGHGDSDGGDTVKGGSYSTPAYTIDAQKGIGVAQRPRVS